MLAYLSRQGYAFLSLEQLLQEKDYIFREKRGVIFTADDGFFDQTEVLAPVFMEYNCPLTIFLVTGFIDGKLWPWDDKVAYVFNNTLASRITIDFAGNRLLYSLPDKAARQRAIADFQRFGKSLPASRVVELLDLLAQAAEVKIPDKAPTQYRPLTWEQARALEKRGVRFAPHSVSHRIFSRMTEEEARREIIESMDRLRQELQYPLPVFAWPTGRQQDFNELSCRLLREIGIKAAFSTEPGCVSREEFLDPEARYMLKRMSLRADITDVIQYVSWIEPFKMHLRAIKHSSMERLRLYFKCKLYSLLLLSGRMHQYVQLDWVRIERLVFVCKGNICRSPYAEYKAKAMHLNAVSFGLRANGYTMANDEAIRQAVKRGIDLMPHTSKTPEMVQLAPSDLVVCMEPWQARDMVERVTRAGAQITLLGLWSQRKAPVIPDPYGRDRYSFAACFNEIDACLRFLAERLQGKA
jgi:protein-tyrosine-phosphatase